MTERTKGDTRCDRCCSCCRNDSGTVKGIFKNVDVDKSWSSNFSGDISDEEWSAFSETFYRKYVACDGDADNMLSEAEMLSCLNASNGSRRGLDAAAKCEGRERGG